MTPGEVSKLPGRQANEGLERKKWGKDVQINVIAHGKDVSGHNCDVYNLETAPEDNEDSGDQMQKSPPEKDPQCLCC